jgi:hypothetical protein
MQYSRPTWGARWWSQENAGGGIYQVLDESAVTDCGTWKMPSSSWRGLNIVADRTRGTSGKNWIRLQEVTEVLKNTFDLWKRTKHGDRSCYKGATGRAGRVCSERLRFLKIFLSCRRCLEAAADCIRGIITQDEHTKEKQEALIEMESSNCGTWILLLSY